jgi:hypothetical protein
LGGGGHGGVLSKGDKKQATTGLVRVGQAEGLPYKECRLGGLRYGHGSTRVQAIGGGFWVK